MVLKINIYFMKYLKKYQKFFEDGEGGGAASSGGTAYADAGIAGMGAVVSAQPGQFAGTTGTTGSGDVGFGLGATKKEKRKKGKPSQVTDLRDLKEEETNAVDESTGYNQFDLATECVELYHWLCEDGVDKEQLGKDIKEITNDEGWYSLDVETLHKLVELLKSYNKEKFSKEIDNINTAFSRSKE
jgi:hypothetical protein